VLVGAVAVLPSLRAYYRTPFKDSDARPIVAYLLDHARHADGQQQDPIYIAPDFMNTMVRYISRRELGYRPFNLAMPASEVGRTTWLIVDYREPRQPRFSETGDRRLEPVDVPGGHPELIRLFRLPAQ
jgi:hypothetical protein